MFAPLIAATHLDAAIEMLAQIEEVIRLQQHVADSVYEMPCSRSSSRTRTESRLIISFTEKCLPISHRKSTRFNFTNQSAFVPHHEQQASK
jgi:hypothetical protein